MNRNNVVELVEKEKVKINIPGILYSALKESADLHKMSISDYLSYLVYKENFFYLSSNSLQKEKHLEKFYEKYCQEKSEKDVWSTLFNLES
jgi:hypothetical protein